MQYPALGRRKPTSSGIGIPRCPVGSRSCKRTKRDTGQVGLSRGWAVTIARILEETPRLAKAWAAEREDRQQRTKGDPADFRRLRELGIPRRPFPWISAAPGKVWRNRPAPSAPCFGFSWPRVIHRLPWPRRCILWCSPSLAQLVATMPGWLTQTLRDTEINLATSPGYSFQHDCTLLVAFDRHVRDAREALTSAQDADFTVLWSLKKGDQALFDRASWGSGAVAPQPPHPSSGPAQCLSPPERCAAAVHLRPDRRRAVVVGSPPCVTHRPPLALGLRLPSRGKMRGAIRSHCSFPPVGPSTLVRTESDRLQRHEPLAAPMVKYALVVNH